MTKKKKTQTNKQKKEPELPANVSLFLCRWGCRSGAGAVCRGRRCGQPGSSHREPLFHRGSSHWGELEISRCAEFGGKNQHLKSESAKKKIYRECVCVVISHRIHRWSTALGFRRLICGQKLPSTAAGCSAGGCRCRGLPTCLTPTWKRCLGWLRQRTARETAHGSCLEP